MTVTTAVFRADGGGIGTGQLHEVHLLAASKLVPLTWIGQIGTVRTRLKPEHCFVKNLGTGEIGNQQADMMQRNDPPFRT